MNIEFRKAEPDDAAEVAEVYLQSRKTYVAFAPLAHSEAEVKQWVAKILIPSGNVEVAPIEEQIVGMCGTAYREPISWIDHLYLKPAFVGQGIGSLLLNRALEKLRRPIRLYTFQENTGACRFYERFGFVAIEYGDGSGNEEGVPDVLYELQ